jgi:hypothetical protein
MTTLRGPRFFRSHPKGRPIQSHLMTRKGMLRTYSNPDPQEEIYLLIFTVPGISASQVQIQMWNEGVSTSDETV